MNNTALILEGGGMRCVYTAGIIDVLIENNISFDACYAVSAGAYHAMSFLSGQKGRAFHACTDYINDRNYFSLHNKITTGDMFGEEFVYHTIPDKLVPYDYEAFKNNPTRFYPVVTNVKTGKAEYPLVEDLKKDMAAVRASGSLPFVSKMVEIGGEKYLDGGIADSIPVKKALDSGCKKAVVVLSQHHGFVKQPTSTLRQAKIVYRRYPEFVEAMATRHIRYNEALRFVEEGEKNGTIFAFYPKKKVEVGRIDKDMTKITALYRDGIADAEEALDELKAFLAK